MSKIPPPDVDPEALARIQASRAKRARVAAHLGGEIPDSVFTLKRDLGLRSRIREWQGERAKRPGGEVTTSSSKRIRHPAQGKGVRPGGDLFSVMPAELVRFFVRFYGVPKGGLYVDPFAGQGVRLQVAALEGLDYFAQDTSQAFVGWIGRELLPRFREQGIPTKAVVQLGDSSARLDLPDAVGDFCFTSPPYWKLEQYPEPVKGALDREPSYEAFLEGMVRVGRELLRVLKPGAFCVFNVADLRFDGRFFPYHADLLVRYRELGFQVWDTWVLKLYASSLGKAFGLGKIERFIAPKAHEYGLVFRRP